jgi:predicted RNA binding protein YcfA (HicA-like mRNA interferase family)
MSKQQKTLERLCRNPPPADFTWKDLKAVLEHLGYTLLNNSGSRRKFYHHSKQALIICHQPHPSPNVDKGCIVDVVEHLKINGFIRR